MCVCKGKKVDSKEVICIDGHSIKVWGFIYREVHIQIYREDRTKGGYLY